MLLLTPAQLDDRRRIASGALAPLADSLSADLEPVMARPLHIPGDKALLSRIGGRCESDGTDLEFDPFSPHAHRCPACGRVHTGEWHDQWWLYPYHLWLAERAVHAAVLHAVRGDPRHRDLTHAILSGYADRYLDYPNRDNVLGPSRLFFSTYLESLWLLHVTIAADLLEHAGDRAVADLVRKRIAAPAVELIEEYHEGTSNRQVWNTAAIVSAHAFLGERPDAAAIAGALADAESTLLQAVGEDGAWYEGDNYHQFAHRGLWYVVTLGERLGYEFQKATMARFTAGFAAPFRSMLPDFTYPARKDSRYAASLRQWRFAETCELGLARVNDPLLRWSLERIYADDIPAGDTGRSRSSGEAERNTPAVGLSRADLGWRSLLFARDALPSEPGVAPRSVTIESQGLTIHRRDAGAAYVALDWGESGGGHGHPDRLNLIFSHGSSRWLDDLGTGSYVDPSLHWYRSTLAHNAPLVDGASQRRVNGELIARTDDGAFSVIAARADGIAPGVRVDRTIVTAADYFIDEVRWWSPHSVRFELPVHFDGESNELRFTRATLTGAGGVEDGFDFIRDAERAIVGPDSPVRLEAVHGTHGAAASLWSDQAIEWLRARGPGQPATESRRFQVIRQHGWHGVIRSVWTWKPEAVQVAHSAGAIEVSVEGRTDRHEFDANGWHVEAADSSAIDIERPPLGLQASPDAGRPGGSADASSAGARQPAGDRSDPELGRSVAPLRAVPLVAGAPAAEWFSDAPDPDGSGWTVFELGAEHYRRSELSWEEAGRPAARVAIRAEPDAIVVDVFAEAPELVLVPADATNPYDNEHPDINGHGVQLYVATDSDAGAWVIVPERPEQRTRVRKVIGWGSWAPPEAVWRERRGGFEIRTRIPFRAARGRLFGIDLVVNDAEPGRMRRRGQLVMTGAAGEFVYLRGDRHDPGRLIPFSVT